MQVNNFWQECHQKIKQIAKDNNIGLILFGSGNDVKEPCLICTTKDALSGEGIGYNVFIYPKGQGYMKPYKYVSIN